MMGGEAVKSLNEHWLLQGGLQFETKGMETRAQVKSYNLTMVSGSNGEISGVFTGAVRTRIKNSYLTAPVSAAWRLHRQASWRVKAGIYGSFLLDGDFGGSADNGYLRKDDPTGEKINITTAGYDFSGSLQQWSWGVLLGAEWRPLPNLLAGVDLTWGVNSIFKKNFDVITYKMYPIYATVSFGYIFKAQGKKRYDELS